MANIVKVKKETEIVATGDLSVGEILQCRATPEQVKIIGFYLTNLVSLDSQIGDAERTKKKLMTKLESSKTYENLQKTKQTLKELKKLHLENVMKLNAIADAIMYDVPGETLNEKYYNAMKGLK